MALVGIQPLTLAVLKQYPRSWARQDQRHSILQSISVEQQPFPLSWNGDWVDGRHPGTCHSPQPYLQDTMLGSDWQLVMPPGLSLVLPLTPFLEGDFSWVMLASLIMKHIGGNKYPVISAPLGTLTQKNGWKDNTGNEDNKQMIYMKGGLFQCFFSGNSLVWGRNK